MTTRLITGPSVEPVTLAEAKLQCRVDDATDDTLITSLIKAARAQCEHILQRSLITQTWENVLDSFPCDGIKLVYPTIISITSVKYIDANTATEVTLASNQYSLDKDSEPGWLLPAVGVSWPNTLDTANAVRVRYTAGYGADASFVPDGIANWIKLAVCKMYERDCAGDSNYKLPGDFYSGLLDRYRIWDI
jgi:uncharacterized phiE125 gp8 family phage protein